MVHGCLAKDDSDLARAGCIKHFILKAGEFSFVHQGIGFDVLGKDSGRWEKEFHRKEFNPARGGTNPDGGGIVPDREDLGSDAEDFADGRGEIDPDREEIGADRLEIDLHRWEINDDREGTGDERGEIDMEREGKPRAVAAFWYAPVECAPNVSRTLEKAGSKAGSFGSSWWQRS